MTPEIVYGDILKQNVEVIVNAWNRNIIPWWQKNAIDNPL
jgi:hypothetical protein